MQSGFMIFRHVYSSWHFWHVFRCEWLTRSERLFWLTTLIQQCRHVCEQWFLLSWVGEWRQLETSVCGFVAVFNGDTSFWSAPALLVVHMCRYCLWIACVRCLTCYPSATWWSLQPLDVSMNNDTLWTKWNSQILSEFRIIFDFGRQPRLNEWR